MEIHGDSGYYVETSWRSMNRVEFRGSPWRFVEIRGAHEDSGDSGGSAVFSVELHGAGDSGDSVEFSMELYGLEMHGDP